MKLSEAKRGHWYASCSRCAVCYENDTYVRNPMCPHCDELMRYHDSIMDCHDAGGSEEGHGHGRGKLANA